MVIKLLGTEVDIGTTANTVGDSKLIRIINTSGSSSHVANVAYSNGTVYASITLGKDEVVILEKGLTDTVVGPNLKAVAVAYRN